MTLSPLRAGQQFPHAPACLFGDDLLSFRDVAVRVSHALAWLAARGVDPNDSEPAPVAVVGRPDRATISIVYALIEAAIPALMLHPRLTDAERSELIDEARPSLVFDSSRHGDPAAPAAAPAQSSFRPIHDPKRIADRPLAVVYTSGTTDRPKGAVLSRRAFSASATASASNLGWRNDDRWLLSLPIAHIGGLSILTRCLIDRRPVVIPRELEQGGRLAPEAWMAAVRHHRATIASLVPTQLHALIDSSPSPEPPESLRALLLGGAPASPRLLELAADAGWPALTTYGLTEACSQVTTQPLGTTNRGELGAGRPLAGLEVDVGSDGVLAIRGPTLLSGYLSREGLEAAVDAEGWFKTSDLGRIDEAGYVHILGRASERIITGGENVAPLEVERVLEDLPGIAAACVFGEPDEHWGQVVCAALVPTRSNAPPQNYAALFRERLARHKQPRFIAWLDGLSLTPAKKLDRAATARRARTRLVAVNPPGSGG